MKELTNLIEESAAKLFEDFGESDGNKQMESGEFPADLWQAFVDDGWLSTMLPEDDGGAGLGLAGGCVLMRLAGYHCVPLPVVESLIATSLLAKVSQINEQNLIVPAIVTEQETAEDIKINGVPWARHAKAIAVIQETDTGCSISTVSVADIDLEIGANMAGEPRDDLSINQKHLVNTKQIDGLTVSQIQSWLALGRAAQIAGALQKALEMTVNYANERKQFGRQIGKFQAVQQQLAVQAELSYAARCAVDAAILHLGSEQEWECIAGAKISAAEAAGTAAKTAHAVHAAIGFTEEYALQLSTRRLWSWRDEYGSEIDWSIKLGNYLMCLDGDNLWNNLTKQTA